MLRKGYGLLGLLAAIYLNFILMPMDTVWAAASAGNSTAQVDAVQKIALGRSHDAGDRIGSIMVSVTADKPIPAAIRNRMEKSIAAIADQLLQGQKVSAVNAKQHEYEAIIASVFDKVLVGYDVEQVVLKAADGSSLQVRLKPWADCINAVQTEIAVEGMRHPVEQLVRRDVAGIEKVFKDTLIGLPLGAADWSNGVLKNSVDEFMRQHAPEFRADFSVKIANSSEVQLVLYPRLPVVRTVDLNMRSDTVPNMALLTQRDFMQDKVNQLIMTPVAFVKRHCNEMEAYLADSMDSRDELKQLGISTVVSITPGENLVVMSRSNASKYRFRVEGWADIRHKANDDNHNLMFRLRAGRMLTKRDELFLLMDVYPQDFQWGWDIGYAHALLPGTWIHLRYDVRKSFAKFGLLQKLSDKWFLRYEYRNLNSESEFGIRYKLHDFLSLEYVVDRHDNWLRCIGYF